MIKPEQVPKEAWRAMRDQMREGIRNEATLIAAALALLEAWPGMQHDTEHEKRVSYIILPLTTQENENG